MIFITPNEGNHSFNHPLHVTINCYDSSMIHAIVDDFVMHFETTLGNIKIALSAIQRLERVGSILFSSRDIMEANRFKITCLDGSVIVGIPRSPGAMHVRAFGSLHARGKIKMVDINTMTVTVENQSAKPLATFSGQMAET